MLPAKLKEIVGRRQEITISMVREYRLEQMFPASLLLYWKSMGAEQRKNVWANWYYQQIRAAQAPVYPASLGGLSLPGAYFAYRPRCPCCGR